MATDDRRLMTGDGRLMRDDGKMVTDDRQMVKWVPCCRAEEVTSRGSALRSEMKDRREKILDAGYWILENGNWGG